MLLPIKVARTIAIIGGADGPTSIYVESNLSPWTLLAVIVLVVLVVVAIVLYRKRKQ